MIDLKCTVGKMSVEFNTMMKHYSKLIAYNCKKIGPSYNQWEEKTMIVK